MAGIGPPATLIAGTPVATRDAAASPIRYASAGRVAPANDSAGPALVGFAGASGTVAAGTAFALGSFVLGPPSAAAPGVYNNVPFAIAVRAPELDRIVDPPGAGGEAVRVEAGWLVTGRLNGALGGPSSGLTATFDSVSPGGLDGVASGHLWYTSPIAAAGLQLPASVRLDAPADGRSGPDPRSVPIVARVVPEPSALVVLAAGIAAAALRNRPGAQPAGRVGRPTRPNP